ncbi:ATP-dependent helicase, partial [Streptomyces sp. 8ZJF_21]|nr:ATP-dependent helicase [Streptomyces sp. 8ZJF_21]
MTPPSAATPSDIAELCRCTAVFLPGDPARTGRIAFWRPDGGPPSGPATGSAEELTVVVPVDDPDGGSTPADIDTRTVRALVLPLAEALPVLTRARARAAQAGPGQCDPATAFWGAAAVLALQLAARGRLLPGLTATDHDAWRVGPLTPDDLTRVRELAAAMPPTAHATPMPASGPVLLPEPERQLRAFLDAVADGLPRSP